MEAFNKGLKDLHGAQDSDDDFDFDDLIDEEEKQEPTTFQIPCCQDGEGHDESSKFLLLGDEKSKQ